MSAESILLFKPDASNYSLEIGGSIYLLHEIGRSLLVLSGLDVTSHITTRLEPIQVRAMYSRALAPNAHEDAIYGTQWKEDVVSHLSSAPIEAYFVYDKESRAEIKAKTVKNFLRQTLVPPSNVVENIAHVPDKDEYDMVRSILIHEE
jgi:hypothetical protein